MWVNGHEWAKRQCVKTGIGLTALSNGFASCDDPAGLQALCDRLGPGAINVFFERWMSVLPLPLTDADRAAGYGWAAVHAPGRDLPHHPVRRTPAGAGIRGGAGGRQPRPGPPRVGGADLHRQARAPRTTTQAAAVFKTTLVTCDTEVTINAFFKHSRVKQYLKDGRALRIETVVNSPDDLGCPRRLHHLDQLQVKAP